MNTEDIVRKAKHDADDAFHELRLAHNMIMDNSASDIFMTSLELAARKLELSAQLTRSAIKELQNTQKRGFLG